jgi:signal peptidase I
MKQRKGVRVLMSVARLLAILLVAFAMSLALLIITQRVFNPFHVVISDSMSPQIRTGDAVIMKDMDTANVPIGTVIIFNDPNNRQDMVIHRVVAVEDRGGVKFYSTKGDNNAQPDNWKISMGEVLGGVAVTLPKLGSFLDFMTTARGYVSCIVIPAAAALLLVMLLGFGEKLADLIRRDTAVPQ